MIPFKDITLADKDTITSFTMKSDRRNCDLSFSNLCSWRFLYDTQFAVVDNFLVFKFWAGEQLAYMMPVGTGDLKAVLWELIEDARKENQHFCMHLYCIRHSVIPNWGISYRHSSYALASEAFRSLQSLLTTFCIHLW